MESSLERLVGRKDVLAVRASHPWHDVEPVAMDMGKQQEFLHSLESLLGAINDALPKFTSLAGNAHIGMPKSLADCRRTIDLANTIIATKFPLKNWFEPRLIDGLIERVESEKASFSSMDSSRKSLLAKYNAKVLELDSEHLGHKFEVEYSGTLRSMNSDYRTDIKVLSMHLLNRIKLEYEEALNDVRALKIFQEARNSLNSNRHGDYKSFGRYFDGPGTDWDVLLSSLRWAKALMQKAGADLNDELVGLVCDDPEGIAKVRKELDRVRPSLEALAAASLVPGQYLRGGEFLIGDVPFGSVPLTDARDFVATHLAAKDRLREWVELREAEEQVRASGLDSLLELVDQGADRRRPAGADVPQALLHAVDRFVPAPCSAARRFQQRRA